MMVGVPLKLPKTTAQTVAQPKKPVMISLDKEGRLFIGENETTFDDVTSRLAEQIKDDPQLVAYVRADRSVDYGRIMDLLGRVGNAGVERLSLLAEGQPLPASGRP
jgi:biopolymer transport protein ExbD/biopolymer transport protein TolR